MKKRKWQTLSEELAELERTDPAVAQAAQNLDDTIWRIGSGIPVARFPRKPEAEERK